MVFFDFLRRVSAGGWLLGFGAATVMAFPDPAVSEAPVGAGFVSDLKNLPPQDWYVSTYKVKKKSFRTLWSRDALRHDPKDGALVLTLAPALPSTGKYHASGEVQRRQPTLYGRYEVVMTAARGEGIISSFFTYTGPYFKTQHDEIDFEFLGRDTTKVWVNRFVDGKKLPGQWLDLGFDAAEGPHLYAFDWQPDSLTWFADGRELLRVTAAEADIPATPQKIYFNVWGGGKGQANWSGTAPENIRTSARYYCVSYRPPGDEGAQCADRPLSE